MGGGLPPLAESSISSGVGETDSLTDTEEGKDTERRGGRGGERATRSSGLKTTRKQRRAKGEGEVTSERTARALHPATTTGWPAGVPRAGLSPLVLTARERPQHMEKKRRDASEPCTAAEIQNASTDTGGRVYVARKSVAATDLPAHPLRHRRLAIPPPRHTLPTHPSSRRDTPHLHGGTPEDQPPPQPGVRFMRHMPVVSPRPPPPSSYSSAKVQVVPISAP